MITKLEVENFYSIGEAISVDLTVGGKVPEEPGRLVAVHTDSPDRAPRVVAVYGPNAAGKSNVLRALAFVSWFIRNSFQFPAGKPLPFHKFNSDEKVAAPTRFSLTFEGLEDPLGDADGPSCLYTYSLEIAGRHSSSDHVSYEALFYKPSGAIRPRRIFERDNSGSVKVDNLLKGSREISLLPMILRPDASLIATLGQMNNQVAQAMIAVASSVNTNILMTRVALEPQEVQDYYASNAALVTALNRDIRKLDLGINEMVINQRDGRNHAVFLHEGLDMPISMMLESHGTQQFITIFPLIHQVLATGGVAVIDELDTSIHPSILPEIVRWFWDPERNPHGAQLWTSCHSVSLMDELLKEEIILCEKDRRGSTQAYRLADIKGLRRDENFSDKYMSGVYGAIPVIG